MSLKGFALLSTVVLLSATIGQARQSAVQSGESAAPSFSAQNSSDISGLRLVKFGGVLRDQQGQPLTGVAGVTFSVYKDQEGGAPLWTETQNVQVNPQGNYGALLGSTSGGIPLEILSSNEPRWLGVKSDSPDSAEQPRLLLVSVPYAVKAADADTLGGKPASAFVLAPIEESDSRLGGVLAGKNSSGTPLDVNPKFVAGGTGAGTPNQVIKWADATGTLADASIQDNGTGVSLAITAANNVGIGRTDPYAKFMVSGTNGEAFIDPVAGNGVNLVLRNTATGGRQWSFRTSFSAPGQFGIRDDSAGFERMTFDTNGNVGIGRTDPYAKFMVAGTNGEAFIDPVAGNGVNLVLRNTTTGGRQWSLRTSFSAPGQFGIRDDATGVERMTFDATGNVGIGTVTPAQPLDVNGNVNASGSVTAASFSGNGASLTSLNAANIASGTLGTNRGGTGVTSAQGNGPQVQRSTGTTTANDCVKFDANGNTIDAGTACGIGTITSLVAGFGLTGGATSGAATLNMSQANRTRNITYLAGCDSCSVLTTADAQKTIYQNLIGTMTINSVTCFADAGGPTIQVQRDPGTGPVSILTAPLQCTTAGATTPPTGTLAQTTLSLNDQVHFVLPGPDGTAHRVTVIISATVN